MCKRCVRYLLSATFCTSLPIGIAPSYTNLRKRGKRYKSYLNTVTYQKGGSSYLFLRHSFLINLESSRPSAVSPAITIPAQSASAFPCFPVYLSYQCYCLFQLFSFDTTKVWKELYKVRQENRNDGHWVNLFKAARTQCVFDRAPTAALPCLTASMAYSTWWRRPTGLKVVTSPSYCRHFLV